MMMLIVSYFLRDCESKKAFRWNYKKIKLELQGMQTLKFCSISVEKWKWKQSSSRHTCQGQNTEFKLFVLFVAQLYNITPCRQNQKREQWTPKRS